MLTMKAVILSAGKGTRLSKITENIPKALIEIGGKKILERQIQILLENGITKIFVVIGYKADKIREQINFIEKVELIENKEYATTDNIYSLYLANNELRDGEFILLNGDTVFEEDIIKLLVSKKGDSVAPVDSEYYDLEELKIKEENGYVVEILSKSVSREISNGSTIGIFKFSSEGSKALFFEIEKLTREGVKNKWFEYALNNVLKKIKMYKIDISGMKWIEVDTIEDLKRSEKLFG